MNNKTENRFNALILKNGILVLRVPQKASPARGIKRLLSNRQESDIDLLLREVARQESAALVFPNSWEFLKQARARKSVRRARLVRSFGAVAACLVVAAAGILFFRSQNLFKSEKGPAPMAADSSAESYGLGDIMPDTVREQPVDSPLCAAAPSQTSAPEMSIQENAIIPDAGNSRTGGSADTYDAADLANGEVVNFEIRTIGEASTELDTQSLKDQGVTAEYGVSSPVKLLPGEAAVCTRDDGSLSLYYHYNDEDTLRLTKEGADEETLFSYAERLAQEG